MRSALPLLLLAACGLGRWLDPASFTPELGTLHLLTPLLLLAGTGFAWRLLGRLGRQYALNRIGLAGHRLLLVLTGLGLVMTL